MSNSIESHLNSPNKEEGRKTEGYHLVNRTGHEEISNNSNAVISHQCTRREKDKSNAND
jgi:hypothetical protein